MWFKVDDGLPFHPKVMACSNQAMGTWLMMGTWSSQQLTNGFVPTSALTVLRATDSDLSELADAGMIQKTRGGWRLHDFLDYNPPADDTRARRARERERKRMWREKKAAERSAGQARDGQGQFTAVVPRDIPSTEECVPNQGGTHAPHGDTQGTAGTRDNTRDIDGTQLGQYGDYKEEHITGQSRDTETVSPATRPVPSRPVPSPTWVGGAGGELTNAGGQDAGAMAPAASKKTRGTRLREDWFPTRTDANIKAETGHDRQWLERELERFRDHWASATGQRAVHADWDATWRNWIRRAEDTGPRNRQQETDTWFRDAQQRAASGAPNPIAQLMGVEE